MWLMKVPCGISPTQLSSKRLNNVTYKPIGRCIYCGATTDLRREHILPFGLSGTALLPESTCGRCAKITGRVEQTVLRGPMWAVRVFRDLKSRTKHKDAPKTYPLTVVRGDHEEVVHLAVEEYPILLHFPLFSSPALLEPEGYVSGIRVTGVATVSFGPRPEDVIKRLGVTTIRVSQTQEPVAFARMLAKIAYAMAAAEDQLGLIEGDATVLPAILGEADDIGRWVGTLSQPFRAYSGLLHRVLVHQNDEKGLLIGEVQLFSDSQAPSYGVILGRLR
jgi:hypothetical protein